MFNQFMRADLLSFTKLEENGSDSIVQMQIFPWAKGTMSLKGQNELKMGINSEKLENQPLTGQNLPS